MDISAIHPLKEYVLHDGRESVWYYVCFLFYDLTSFEMETLRPLAWLAMCHVCNMASASVPVSNYIIEKGCSRIFLPYRKTS